MMSCRPSAAVLRLPTCRQLVRPRRDATFQRAMCCSVRIDGSFGWEDVFRSCSGDGERSPGDFSSYLDGFFERVRSCNRGSEFRSDFVPFVVEERTVGYVHRSFLHHLESYDEVFTLMLKSSNYAGECVTLHPLLSSPEERTIAIGEVIKSLGPLIPDIRNELYPVGLSYSLPPFFSLERAAAPYFGIKAYGVHMNGYVEKNEKKYLWVAKRSNTKPTYPGMLDHLVAGGLGISCKDNIIKECQEEAGIPKSISCRSIPVGACSYVDINGPRCKRDVIFCYDLRLPADFVPKNEDGEVDSFKLIPVEQVAEIIRRTEFFKPNCALIIIDFLFRHGFLSPEEAGYLELLPLLRGGDCS